MNTCQNQPAVLRFFSRITRHPLAVTLTKVSVLVAVCAVVVAVPASLRAETWTDTTGSHNVEADFLALRGNVVYLKKQNGVIIAVPMDRLSLASQQLARQSAVPADDNSKPDAAVRNLIANLESGNFRALWDALPADYQTDVNDVIRTFAQNMDPDVWNAGRRILGKAVSVLKDKKQFILGYPALQQSAVDLAPAEKNWDAVVGLLGAVVNSELTDLEKLKTFEVSAFLDGTGKELGTRMAALAKAVEQDVDPAKMAVPPGLPGAEVVQLADIKNVKVSTVSLDGDQAVIRIEKADGKTEDHEAVLVDGKWLPKEMVDGWDEGIAKAKAYLATDMPQQLQENKQMLLSPLSPVKMVEGVLDQMLAAQDQNAFNQVIDGVMQTAGGLMGGAAGSGGFPGDGDAPADMEPGGAGGADDPFGVPPAGAGGGDAYAPGGSGAAADPFGN